MDLKYKKGDMREKFLEIFNRLFERFGPQHWWPANTKDEVVIGAILTQNTAWKNVEKALNNLRNSDLLELKKLSEADIETIKHLIKPAGFFNQKAVYLKNISRFFIENRGFEELSKLDTKTLRKKLLNVKGVGKETADSILLYVFKKPIFVVDTYTKRLIKRHNLCDCSDYDEVQKLFMENLPLDEKLFNEYHALIVKLAKEYCKKRPICNGCPLEDF